MKTIATLIFCIACTWQALATDIKATMECMYEATYQTDTLAKRTTKALMVLRRNEERSLYFSQSGFEYDSLSQNATGLSGYYAVRDTIKARYGGIKAHYYVLKDFVKSQLQCAEMDLVKLQYAEALPLFNWEITEEQKAIGQHQCQKAVCAFGGRTYEAWFAPDIPISDGPWKFWGLPGLIVKVYDTQHHYEFRFLGMRPCTSNIEMPENDCAKSTKAECYRTIQKALDDPEAALRAMEGQMGIKSNRPRAPKLRSYATMERIESLGK